MNVSHEHKAIWWTKPHMGERIVASCFYSHYFFNISEKKGINWTAKDNISYVCSIPDEIKEYSLILSVRNPYFQIVNKFLEISTTNWKLKNTKIEDFHAKLNFWVNDIFSTNQEILLSTDNLIQNILPYKFKGKTPDFILRFENLEEDLKSLPFIGENVFYFNQNLLIDNSKFEKDGLTFENARLIYKIHKKTFDNFGYDPFSFTTTELTHKQKVDFIHW
jgi:hypothetical protein